MSNLDKQALRTAAENATPGEWCADDYHGVIADAGLNANYYIASCSGPDNRANKRFIAAANPATVLALLDELAFLDKRNAELNSKLERWAVDRAQSASELDDAEKRIAELEASHGNLREAMAGIHNTITGGGAYTPLAAILNASKRAYEESAAAAGKGE
ncbi:TPA: ead/Ea22-like family protein [Enterobacter hormaechei subsp. oharae]|nr:ead/Ea22-like family protein [Enterobacter hormaechei subsp. oharae]